MSASVANPNDTVITELIYRVNRRRGLPSTWPTPGQIRGDEIVLQWCRSAVRRCCSGCPAWAGEGTWLFAFTFLLLRPIGWLSRAILCAGGARRAPTLSHA